MSYKSVFCQMQISWYAYEIIIVFHNKYINIIWNLTIIWWKTFAKSLVCFVWENNVFINIASDFINSLEVVWLGKAFTASGRCLNDVSVLGCTLALSNKTNQFCMGEHYICCCSGKYTIYVLENSPFIFARNYTSLILCAALWNFIKISH